MKKEDNMKTLKKSFLVLALVVLAIPMMAQYPGRPTHHDSYANYYFSGGYQYLKHPTGVYHTGQIQIEVLYSFAGGKVGVTYGPDYISFSPFGVLWFTPALFVQQLKTLSPSQGKYLLIPALATMQFHIPLTRHMEMTLGWDALKVTKLRNYSNSFYITGSVNAGLNVFIGNHFYMNAYYEFNHTHNPLIKILSYMVTLSSQPKVLNGHSFGVRVGFML